MKQNVGLLDRLVRMTLAASWGAVFFISGATGGWAIVLISVLSFLALTAIIGTCPLYLLFGIDTHSKQEKHIANNR